MAKHHGNTGLVALATSGNTDANVFNWALTETQETADTTNFDSTAGWRANSSTLGAFSGSFDFYLDDTTPTNDVVTGAAESFTFTTATTGIDFNGQLIITELSTTTSVDGIVTGSCSYIGHGALTKT